MSAAAGISAGASLLSGVIGGVASGNAAGQYIAGLNNAQNYLENTVLPQGQQALQPYLSAGSKATGNLSQLLGTPGQGLLTPWTQTFTAPTAAQAAQTPGYQFQLQQGLSAAQNSAAASGGLLSGGTLAGLNNYAQGVASTNYQNTFNNALTQYQSAYQTFLNNQANTYNMLAGQSAQGLSAAGQNVNLLTGVGGDIASLYGQKGAAAAQGTIGEANAISGGIGGVGNALSGYSTLSALGGLGSSAAVGAYNIPSADSLGATSGLASPTGVGTISGNYAPYTPPPPMYGGSLTPQ